MATYQISAPEPFNFVNTEEWPRWIRRFERFRSSSGLNDKPGKNQVNTLIYSMGDAAEDIFHSFRLRDADANEYDTVKKKFDDHFVKKKNVIFERAKFNRREQEEGEPVDTFITSLYTLASKCEYGELNDDLIRDRIVVGIRNRGLSEKMQLDEELTLEKAVKMARESEAVRKQQPQLREGEMKEIDSLRKNPRDYQKRGKRSPRPRRQPVSQTQEKASWNNKSKESVCTRCGKNHPPGKELCPAKSAKCYRCGKTGHFQRLCKSVATIETAGTDSEQSSEDDYKFLGAVGAKKKQVEEKPWTTILKVNNRSIQFKIDTGADVTAIPTELYNRKRDGELIKTNTPLVGPSQNELTVRGRFEAEIRQGQKVIAGEPIYVIDGLRTALVGRPAIKSLYLLREIAIIEKSKAGIIRQFPELFSGLGQIRGDYEIKLEDNAQPYTIGAPRRVPIPLLPKVKTELLRMEKEGVISRINEPTDWCAGMVVVPKPNDKVRICVDLTRLNRYVKRERHILPSVDQVLAQVGDAKMFSKLDANSGFWQIRLTEDSSKLTTFITPFGRYKFNRLPFGISSAPELFQRRMSETLKSCEGVVGLIDDLLIYGKTKEEHDGRLMRVLERLEKEGVTLNKEKCQFYETEISYLGHIVNDRGVQPDEEKTKAIRNIPTPANVTEIRRFLGMLNQLSKFQPHLANRTKPLRDLLSAKKQWYWGPEQEKAFQDLKKSMCSEECLALYDPNKETVISADASAFGLGAVLRQEQTDGSLRPVIYISRSMTECEQRYAQIEKEALALTWACERLNQYLLGKKFTLETDHKPLVPILSSKNLEDLPIRVQRFRLRMMRYDYTIKHVPGKELNTADFLSRSPLPSKEDTTELQSETMLYVNNIVHHLPVSDNRLVEIKECQQKDPILRKWKTEIEQGSGKGKCMAYGDLSIVDGLILKGDKIVIPQTLKRDTLVRLHQGHQGIQKCKERARNSVWWPGITSDIETFVNQCTTCCQFQQSKVEPMIPSILPESPWQKVGTDLFELNQVVYLLVVDYYSRYIEIAKLTSTTSSGVITQLKSIFARHGIPQLVVSDNGPQYASSQFTQFASTYGFDHRTSSPKYPQANGEAERAVQTVKRLLKKEKDPYWPIIPLQLSWAIVQLNY